MKGGGNCRDGTVGQKKFTYVFYYCKGETFFILTVSLKYIFIWRILRINFQYMSVVTWYLGGGFCSGLLRLLCCCREAGFPKQRLSLAWTAWKLGDLPKRSLLNAGKAVKSL